MGIRMVVTDLDGTLVNPQGRVSDIDISTLKFLGEQSTIRVVATGRTPYSFAKVIPDDFPIDYLVFSSGAGTMNWKTKEILYTTEITATEVQNVVDELIVHKVDFMVHEPIPANHRFLYYQGSNHNPDFDHRIEIFKHFCQPYIPGIPYGSDATQILVVLPHNVKWFESLKNHFPNLKVIRATSPLDGHSIWMEIFRKDVSKAYGIEWLCKKFRLKNQEVITIGNDFNDLDMLCHYENSFVVANAPDELKNQFTCVNSNNDSGFSDMVSKFFG
jgi:Cof subfamily protein (haloacid dehalogenase superfamily)